jgi:hypothetical protein
VVELQNLKICTFEKKSAMQIISVELLNDEALKLLQVLEQLKIIRLSPKTKETPAASEPPKRRWAGSISKETGDKLLQHIEQTRNEWERI